MKRPIIITLLLASTLVITACSNKVEDTSTNDEHNYAVNDVKSKNDDDTDTNNENSEGNSTVVDGVTYVYPTKDDENLYINGIPMARIIDYDFVSGDIKSSDNNYRELSAKYKIYAQSLKDTLNLSDVRSSNTSNTKSLTTFMQTAKEIKIGDAIYKPSDLIVSTDNFDSLIKLLNEKYTSKKTGNADDIFSYAASKKDNDNWGTTYTWIFSINDAKMEYTDEEIASINAKLATVDMEQDEESTPINTNINSEIVVVADYTATNLLSNYTVTLNKNAHFWNKEITREIVNEKGTGQFETVPIDENGNIIPEEDLDKYSSDQITYADSEIMEQTTEIEHTGQYILKQGGYDFTNAYILLSDLSKIGLDSFSYTIHNPKLNKSLDIEYTFE